MGGYTDFSALCISSASGGGGKTLLSLGLGRAMMRKKWLVQPFKKGPDYIDSAWLSLACKRPASNLDPFFLSPEKLKGHFTAVLHGLEALPQNKGLLAMIEGNRGLYDGLDEKGSCSTASLARLLQCPVLLNLDCEKSTRTMAALIRGLTTFEDNLDFLGIILNRTGSARHASALRKSIEYNTNLKILGCLPRLTCNPLPERHMGLASRGAELAEDAECRIESLADFIADNCDLDSLDSSLPSFGLPRVSTSAPLELSSAKIPDFDVKLPRIGYVQDEAFWFYYPENLQALRDAGADTVPLRIIGADTDDLEKWNFLDGLYLGGGFPEDFMEELEASPLLRKIAGYAASGLPIYAECGGMMLLCDSLYARGQKWKMSGVFPYKVIWNRQPQGLGYVEAIVREKNPYYPIGQVIRGHEFHYSSCVPGGDRQKFALELSRGTGLFSSKGTNGAACDALLSKNVWASYTHIFAPAIPCWAENFTFAAKSWKENNAWLKI